MAIPFIPFNSDPESLEQLMVFDREAAKVFAEFKRTPSRFDAPPKIAKSNVEVFYAENQFIYVKQLEPGVRVRFLCTSDEQFRGFVERLLRR